jgi:hypothetical protein
MKMHAILWNLSHTKVLREMILDETPRIRIPVAPPFGLSYLPTNTLGPPDTTDVVFVPFGRSGRSIHFHPESIPSVEDCEEFL